MELPDRSGMPRIPSSICGIHTREDRDVRKKEEAGCHQNSESCRESIKLVVVEETR